jgi:hypothetical protein
MCCWDGHPRSVTSRKTGRNLPAASIIPRDARKTNPNSAHHPSPFNSAFRKLKNLYSKIVPVFESGRAVYTELDRIAARLSGHGLAGDVIELLVVDEDRIRVPPKNFAATAENCDWATKGAGGLGDLGDIETATTYSDHPTIER